MNDPNSTKLAELEALLFVYGDPIEIKKIAKILNIKEGECRELIDRLNEAQSNENRGTCIARRGDRVQLTTKPALATVSQKVVREEFREELSPAGLETLSLIAYLGPIARSTIDFMRGVNSSFTLRNLLMRGLIEREPSKERANVYAYGVSFEFLKHMGLKSVEELPEYTTYRGILEKFQMDENRAVS